MLSLLTARHSTRVDSINSKFMALSRFWPHGLIHMFLLSSTKCIDTSLGVHELYR